MNFFQPLQGAKILHSGHLAHFCCSATKFGSVNGFGAWSVLRDLDELWSTFQGGQIFDSRYFAQFFLEGDIPGRIVAKSTEVSKVK